MPTPKSPLRFGWIVGCSGSLWKIKFDDKTIQSYELPNDVYIGDRIALIDPQDLDCTLGWLWRHGKSFPGFRMPRLSK